MSSKTWAECPKCGSRAFGVNYHAGCCIGQCDGCGSVLTWAESQYNRTPPPQVVEENSYGGYWRRVLERRLKEYAAGRNGGGFAATQHKTGLITARADNERSCYEAACLYALGRVIEPDELEGFRTFRVRPCTPRFKKAYKKFVLADLTYVEVCGGKLLDVSDDWPVD